MTEWLEKMLASKRAMRSALADLPFAEKVKILERLRQRSLLIANSALARQYKGDPPSTLPKP